MLATIGPIGVKGPVMVNGRPWTEGTRVPPERPDNGKADERAVSRAGGGEGGCGARGTGRRGWRLGHRGGLATVPRFSGHVVRLLGQQRHADLRSAREGL